VQFGSFVDESKAREVRQRVERAGLKTYAQVAETSEGKRHRARVGPFATRAEAEKAAAKIKSLDLPANILTL
jgi:DedD protein